MKVFLLFTVSLLLLAEDFTDHKNSPATIPEEKRPTSNPPVYMDTIFAQKETKFKSLRSTKVFTDGVKRMYATDCIVRSGTNFQRKQGVLFVDANTKPPAHPRLYGLYYYKKPYDPNWLDNFGTYKSSQGYYQTYLDCMKDRNLPKALRQKNEEGSEHFLKTNGNLYTHYYLRGVGTTNMHYEIHEVRKEKNKEDVYLKKTVCETKSEIVFNKNTNN